MLNIDGAEIMFLREANGVFVKSPTRVIQYLKDKNRQFYTFIGVGGVRFMCSWNTTKERIDQLINDIKAGFFLEARG